LPNKKYGHFPDKPPRMREMPSTADDTVFTPPQQPYLPGGGELFAFVGIVVFIFPGAQENER